MKPAQRVSSPAVSPIEQRLKTQHEQQAELLPIQQDGSRLILDKEFVLLDDLHHSAKAYPHEAGGTVLSLELFNGAVASYDFALGKVRAVCCAFPESRPFHHSHRSEDGIS